MKKALVIAIGMAYPAPYQLPDPMNNLSLWLTALSRRGFTSITQLTEANATRTNIIAAMNAFVASLGPNDSGAFVFTGHGGTNVDFNGDESDGLDECIASVDVQAISDDTMQGIFSQTARPIDIVLDCCYPDNTNLTIKRLWAAATEYQYAHVGFSGGLIVSLFSLYMCWALRNYPNKTASEIMALICPYITRIAPDQTPQLLGQNLGQVPF